MMNSEAPQKNPDEVSIPLDAESSPQDSPPETETRRCETCCFCFNCFRAFLGVTSIKGGKQITTKPRALRCFWILFVCLSFILVIIICSKVFIAYSKFNTIFQQSLDDMLGKYIPVITLCSNAYFGDSPGIRNLIAHQDFYFKYYKDKARESVAKKESILANYYQSLATVKRYNGRNIHIWENFTKDLLDYRYKKILNVLPRFQGDLQCNLEKERRCVVEPFLNLKYRNCLSLKMRPGFKNMPVSQMFIKGILLAKTNDIGVPSDDELLFPSSRQIDVFIHEDGYLPNQISDFVFSVDRNSWLNMDLKIKQLKRLQTPKRKCLEEPIPTTKHLYSKILMTGKVCQNVKIRRLIRDTCNCESNVMPLNNWPMNDTNFCFSSGSRNTTEAQKLATCEYKVTYGSNLVDFISKCPDACVRKTYNPTFAVNELGRAQLREYERNQLLFFVTQLLATRCRKGKGNPRMCQSLLKTVDLLTKNATLKNNDFYTIEPSKVDYPYWEELQPPMPPEAKKVRLDFKQTKFFIRIRMSKKYVTIETENPVQSIWTTMAQAGGACSFLAGFTFVVIAEVIDVLVTYCWQKNRQES